MAKRKESRQKRDPMDKFMDELICLYFLSSATTQQDDNPLIKRVNNGLWYTESKQDKNGNIWYYHPPKKDWFMLLPKDTKDEWIERYGAVWRGFGIDRYYEWYAEKDQYMSHKEKLYYIWNEKDKDLQGPRFRELADEYQWTSMMIK